MKWPTPSDPNCLSVKLYSNQTSCKRSIGIPRDSLSLFFCTAKKKFHLILRANKFMPFDHVNKLNRFIETNDRPFFKTQISVSVRVLDDKSIIWVSSLWLGESWSLSVSQFYDGPWVVWLCVLSVYEGWSKKRVIKPRPEGIPRVLPLFPWNLFLFCLELFLSESDSSVLVDKTSAGVSRLKFL